jgi:hypothetical protein
MLNSGGRIHIAGSNATSPRTWHNLVQMEHTQKLSSFYPASILCSADAALERVRYWAD